MNTIEIARRFASLGQTADAVKAYALATTEDHEPAELLEAAAYVLHNGGNYRIAYTTFIGLYSAGYYREETLSLITKAFYEPNARLLKNRYERNCKLLARYPYFFRQDFPDFADLPISFFPYDDQNGYIPFDLRTWEFGEFVNVKYPLVSRNFFRDLDKPILAEDVFSQYELSYLRDNVRPSEYIGRENHIYLHYTDWPTFCAWLQVLSFKPLLEGGKFVFLIEDEIAQYPIDFKERFGIDYSQFPLKPIGIREVNKLIWHTQLATHNGGDFFNEIFDSHPNLLCFPSIMLDNIREAVESERKALDKATSLKQMQESFSEWNNPRIVQELYYLRNVTDKDLLVAQYLSAAGWQQSVDPSARIAPALFFQPHFPNIVYELNVDRKGNTVLNAENVDQLHDFPIFREFKYIKTFTPMRRFTTSHGATVKFMYESALKAQDAEEKDGKTTIVPDAVTQRVLNRSYMRDPEDRMYQDSIVVRFEDGKLNPRATFTALAAFLDLPYTESMTYCSEKGERDPESIAGNVRGFDPAAIYRTYDDYVNDSERKYIEFFLRDAYEFYGYKPQWYDGGEVDRNTVMEWLRGFDTIDHYIRETWVKIYDKMEISSSGVVQSEEVSKKVRDTLLENQLKKFAKNRETNSDIMMKGLRFINKRSQPLHFTPLLELDPALLENPVYH